MKYKNIYAAIHNFGHSFLSLMNYIDDIYVIDQLWEIRARGINIEIDWLTGAFSPEGEGTPSITKSVNHYAAGLNEHLCSHNVDPLSIHQLKLVIPARGRKYMLARDDRDKEYKIYVSEHK